MVKLSEEWDYEKNDPLGFLPNKLSAGSNKKVYWKCGKCEHSWKAFVNDRTNGHGCPKCVGRIYVSYEEAKTIVHKLQIKSVKGYTANKEIHKKYSIPAAPDNCYKNKGWVSWGEYLGTNRIADNLKVFRSFEEAREFVRALKFQSKSEWESYCKTGNKPDDIPAGVYQSYKDKGWISWPNFLGTEFPDLETCKSFAIILSKEHKWHTITEYQNFCRSPENKYNLPIHPNEMFDSFPGWEEYLGLVMKEIDFSSLKQEWHLTKNTSSFDDAGDFFAWWIAPVCKHEWQAGKINRKTTFRRNGYKTTGLCASCTHQTFKADMIEYRGEITTIRRLAEKLNIPYMTLYSRLKKGQTVDEDTR